MSFDIYGNRLERGFCEVHPHVRQEYPCDLCLTERQRPTARSPYPKCGICGKFEACADSCGVPVCSEACDREACDREARRERDGRDDALVAVKAMHKLLDRDWAIVDRDITLRCESHDQAWNYLHEMRDLVRAALENVVPYKEPQS